MVNKYIAGAAIALALGGCAMPQTEAKLPAQPGADQVAMTKEQNGRFLAFVGPKVQHAGPFLGVDDTNYFALRSWLDTKSGEAANQLYVEDSYYGGPFNWDGVHDDASNQPLRFIAISRNEITCDLGCAYADEFAVALTEEMMRAHRDSGLSVTFTAKDGKKLSVSVPGRMLAEELIAVDSTRAALAANAQKIPLTAPAPPAPAAAATAPTTALAPGTVVPAPKPN